jgi:hypothetical protein
MRQQLEASKNSKLNQVSAKHHAPAAHLLPAGRGSIQKRIGGWIAACFSWYAY